MRVISFLFFAVATFLLGAIALAVLAPLTVVSDRYLLLSNVTTFVVLIGPLLFVLCALEAARTGITD